MSGVPNELCERETERQTEWEKETVALTTQFHVGGLVRGEFARVTYGNLSKWMYRHKKDYRQEKRRNQPSEDVIFVGEECNRVDNLFFFYFYCKSKQRKIKKQIWFRLTHFENLSFMDVIVSLSGSFWFCFPPSLSLILSFFFSPQNNFLFGSFAWMKTKSFDYKKTKSAEWIEHWKCSHYSY